MSETSAETLSIEEVARRTGLSLSWLRSARQYGYGPPTVREGRSARYPQDKLAAWIARHVKMADAPSVMYRQWLRDHGLTEVPHVQG